MGTVMRFWKMGLSFLMLWFLGEWRGVSLFYAEATLRHIPRGNQEVICIEFKSK